MTNEVCKKMNLDSFSHGCSLGWRRRMMTRGIMLKKKAKRQFV
jgi:hypothetical protein